MNAQVRVYGLTLTLPSSVLPRRTSTGMWKTTQASECWTSAWILCAGARSLPPQPTVCLDCLSSRQGHAYPDSLPIQSVPLFLHQSTYKGIHELQCSSPAMTTAQKTNVLVYSGAGVSQSCLLHLKTSLKALLSPRYDVLSVSAQALANDPWKDNCALLACPGGRDLGFLTSLGEKGCKRIADWVREEGGRYLGLCAGAYFASSQIEFESGREGFEVKGDRPLKFFNGTCRGTAFPGFLYDSEEGARDAVISLQGDIWTQVWPDRPSSLSIYYNGGGFFDEPALGDATTTVLARYEELESRPAAGVLCQVGQHGKAVLWGVHPEHPSVVSAGATGNAVHLQEPRLLLLKASLTLLDLIIPLDERKIAGVTPHLLVAERPADAGQLAEALASQVAAKSESGRVLLADVQNNFCFHPQQNLLQVFEGASANNDSNLDIVVCSQSLPSQAITPVFNISLFYQNLAKARSRMCFPFRPEFGSEMLYGEVVTSTQTVLERYGQVPDNQPLVSETL